MYDIYQRYSTEKPEYTDYDIHLPYSVTVTQCIPVYLTEHSFSLPLYTTEHHCTFFLTSTVPHY